MSDFDPITDWDPTEDGAYEGTCDHCGAHRLVCRTVNPFVAEVWPDAENEASDWCWPCWEERKAGV